MPEVGFRIIVPDALQVGGYVDGQVIATDGEVSSILKIKLFEEEPVGAVAVGRLGVVIHQRLGCHGAGSIAQLEIYAVHEFGELCGVCGEYCRPSVLHCGIDDFVVAVGYATACAADTGRLAVVEVGSCDEIDGDLCGVADLDAFIRLGEVAVSRYHSECRAVVHGA